MTEQAPASKLPPLFEASTYAVTNAGPRFLDRHLEGDVAYYGLIAKSRPEDDDLVEQLLRHRKPHGWEFSTGYGVTSADSAFALEGLVDRPELASLVDQSLERLIERYWDAAVGAFETVFRGRGRAAYWSGCAADVSAAVAYLLARRRGPDDARVRRVMTFVAGQQLPEGTWSSRWFASHTLPTHLAVRLLALDAKRYAEALERARVALGARQRADGSFMGSRAETAVGALAFAELGDSEDRARALDWLDHGAGRHAGEDQMLFWFDLPSGARRLYVLRDRGEVTRAWERLARQ